MNTVVEEAKIRQECGKIRFQTWTVNRCRKRTWVSCDGTKYPLVTNRCHVLASRKHELVVHNRQLALLKSPPGAGTNHVKVYFYTRRFEQLHLVAA